MVIKNDEWNIMLTFLQRLAAISEGKVEHQKIRKGTGIAFYMNQQKMKCD